MEERPAASKPILRDAENRTELLYASQGGWWGGEREKKKSAGPYALPSGRETR